MNKRNLIILFFYFFQRFLLKSTEYINITDDVDQYFETNWVKNIKNKRNTVIVKMKKIKEKDGTYLNDYQSNYESDEKYLNHKGNEYKIKITVKNGHNLIYDIKKKQDINWVEITDENDEKIFYDYNGRDEKTNKNIYNKYPANTLSSYNWVLAKIKPKNKDEYFYVFINDINHICGSVTYCCLGYASNIKDFYFIYSEVTCVEGISRTLKGYHTQLENIYLKGLNWYKGDSIILNDWFENALDLKKIHDFPDFKQKIDIKGMVKGCKNLENADLGNNIIDDASSCFLECENLKNVNLKNVSITENADLSNMFNYCQNLEKIQGIETLVKENDKPKLKQMFTDCNIKNLDLSQWGTNMENCKYLFYNSKIENLTLFDLKTIMEKNKERIKNNKKKIDEFYKKYPNESLNSKMKSLILLDRRYRRENLNFEEKKRMIDLQNDDEIKKVENLENYKKEFEDIIKMELENGLLESPDILKGSTIVNLNIKEEFMPENKKDLDKILGDGYNITGDINIVKKNGEIVKYKSFNDYQYKEQEKPTETNDQQIPEDIKEEESQIPKGNPCLFCSAKCCSKCCTNCFCCCHDKNKRKRSNTI